VPTRAKRRSGAGRSFINPETLFMKMTMTLVAAATLGLWTQAAGAQTLSEYPMPAFTNADPFGSPVQWRDGNLYGETGNITPGFYVATPDGTITQLVVQGIVANAYVCTSGMILASDGNFYGTCAMAGGGTADIAFRFTPDGAGGGTFTPIATIYTDPNGYTSNPGGLVQATDGNFYGTSYVGRDTSGFAFRITPGGSVTILHGFSTSGGPNYTNGPLIQALDGKLYGSSGAGSTICCGNGTVYSMTLQGKVKVLYNFASGNTNPTGPLVQGPGNSFYGMTQYDGQYGDGTIFKVTTHGVYTDLHDVNAATDGGASPRYGLLLATDGNFYGSLTGCVPSGCGASGSFKMTSTGVFTPLFSFNPDCAYATTTGCIPSSGVIQDTNGTLYGVLEQGGVNDAGMLYAETTSPLLKPGVSLQETSGATGSVVDILGQGFLQAGKVTFGTLAASFAVVSDTYMTATVPAGAASGYVTVREGRTVLKSARKFVVN
jgi:uncharacterized repeat protein (TIGR03803 family)